MHIVYSIIMPLNTTCYREKVIFFLLCHHSSTQASQGFIFFVFISTLQRGKGEGEDGKVTSFLNFLNFDALYMYKNFSRFISSFVDLAFFTDDEASLF